jgi:hypothetical protein
MVATYPIKQVDVWPLFAQDNLSLASRLALPMGSDRVGESAVPYVCGVGLEAIQ